MEKVLGRVGKWVDADGHTGLSVVSDHDFGSTESWINVNRWLQQLGWLRVKPRTALRKRMFYEAMKLNDSAWSRR